MVRRSLLAAGVLAVVALTSVQLFSPFSLHVKLFQRSPAAKTTRAPVQFQIFCLNNPADCQDSKQTVVPYATAFYDTLSKVNSEVNTEIKPRADLVDTWQISSNYGDCDDYVMTKRHDLIQMGVPASALRVAVVKTPKGEGHAVLIAATTKGEYVLDNLRKKILLRSQTGYHFLKVSTGNSKIWTS